MLSVSLLELAVGAFEIPSHLAIPIVGAVRVLDIILLLSIVFYFEKNLSVTGIDSSDIPRGLKRGALWSGAFGFTALVLGLILYFFGHNPLHLIRSNLPKSPAAVLSYFLVAGIIGPVAEEIFFRGIVFGYFRRMGFWFALCFSTFFFVSLHTVSSGIPLPQLVGGIVFAVAYEVEQTLFVPLTIHILGNIAIFSTPFLTS